MHYVFSFVKCMYTKKSLIAVDDPRFHLHSVIFVARYISIGILFHLVVIWSLVFVTLPGMSLLRRLSDFRGFFPSSAVSADFPRRNCNFSDYERSVSCDTRYCHDKLGLYGARGNFSQSQNSIFKIFESYAHRALQMKTSLKNFTA